MRKFLVIFLTIFPIIFLPVDICYLIRIQQKFPIQENDLSLIQEIWDMEPKVWEFIDIIKSKEDHLSDYEELVLYALESYGTVLTRLSLKEIYDSKYVSARFFIQIDDFYDSSWSLVATSKQLFQDAPSPTEYYNSFIEFQKLGSQSNLTDTFHIFITNFHENLRLLLAKGEELYA